MIPLRSNTIKNYLVIGPQPSGVVGGLENLVHTFCKTISHFEKSRVFYLSKWDLNNVRRNQPYYYEYGPWVNWSRIKRGIFRLYLYIIRPRAIFFTANYVCDISDQLCNNLKIPNVLFVHGVEIWSNLGENEVKRLNKVDAIIANSNFNKNYVKELISSEIPIYVLHPCVDTNLFKPQGSNTIKCIKSNYGLGCGPIMLTVGRLNSKEQQKGHDLIIKSLPVLLKRFPTLEYVIVGEGDDISRLKAIAEECGVTAKTHFLGKLPDHDLIGIYSSCDIFAMPSIFQTGEKPKGEGFGIVYIEAASCEKPSIGGNKGGVIDAIVHGETGYLVDPTDIHDFIEHASLLLSNPDRCQRMGKEARKRVVREFSETAYSEKVRILLNNIECTLRG